MEARSLSNVRSVSVKRRDSYAEQQLAGGFL
jgi:hypothetical protein